MDWITLAEYKGKRLSVVKRVMNKSNEMQEDSRMLCVRLSSCISLDLLYIHNGDEPPEKKTVMNIRIR